MSYVADTFVAGEQPTTAKWNELWGNDASFNDGSGIGSGAIGTSALATGVQIVDKEKNPYKFKASMNGATNTGNGIFAVVPFDTEQFDTGNNLSAGVFTTPVAGFYQFNWVITATVSAGANEYLTASLHRNGTRTADGDTAYGLLSQGSNGSVLIQLAANDTVDIRAYCSGAARPLAVGTIYNNHFSGNIVSLT